MPSTPSHWLTRPVADSEFLSHALAVQGMNTILSPVMEIYSIDAALPNMTPDAVVLTSRHAAHALKELNDTSIPIFCVGSATAEAARQMGHTHIITGDGDVLSLVPQILTAAPEHSNILYLSGDDVRIDLPTLLKAKQRHVERIIAYKAESAQSLTPELLTALKQKHITSVSFFSPRSASVAIALLKQHGMEKYASFIRAYCLSLAVAEAAAMLPWQSIDVCQSPTAISMQDLIVSQHTKRV